MLKRRNTDTNLNNLKTTIALFLAIKNHYSNSKTNQSYTLNPNFNIKFFDKELIFVYYADEWQTDIIKTESVELEDTLEDNDFLKIMISFIKANTGKTLETKKKVINDIDEILSILLKKYNFLTSNDFIEKTYLKNISSSYIENPLEIKKGLFLDEVFKLILI